MALKTFHEQQRRFDQLARELIADGILEKGWRDPEKTACPGCGEHTRVSYTLAAQEVSCHTLHVGDKPGCGEAFTLRAAAPMHTLSWDPAAHALKDPAERVAKCLRPIWHRDVGPDHPARSRYRELRNQFFHDIGIELN